MYMPGWPSHWKRKLRRNGFNCRCPLFFKRRDARLEPKQSLKLISHVSTSSLHVLAHRSWRIHQTLHSLSKAILQIPYTLHLRQTHTRPRPHLLLHRHRVPLLHLLLPRHEPRQAEQDHDEHLGHRHERVPEVLVVLLQRVRHRRRREPLAHDEQQRHGEEDAHGVPGSERFVGPPLVRVCKAQSTQVSAFRSAQFHTKMII
jgi:hypothetical protein